MLNKGRGGRGIGSKNPLARGIERSYVEFPNISTHRSQDRGSLQTRLTVDSIGGATVASQPLLDDVSQTWRGIPKRMRRHNISDLLDRAHDETSTELGNLGRGGAERVAEKVQ